MPTQGSTSGNAGTRSVHSTGSAVASWIFGGVLLGVLIAILFILPEPTEFQLNMTRFIMALTAAFLAYFFVGGIVLKGTVLGRALGASGGFVFFILIQFLSDPFSLKTRVADLAPGVSRADPAVERAQRELAQRGLYRGPITGKADTQTREAIRQFQASKNLAPDGYLGTRTRQELLRPPG